MEKEIIEKIIDTLCDRGGFDDWRGNIDTEIQIEIKEELENIIKSKQNFITYNVGAALWLLLTHLFTVNF